MIPEFRKILFTSDLTDNSRHAFSYAASLASRCCAEIVFLYVMEDVPHSAKGFLDQEILEQIRRSALDSATRSLVGKRKDMAMLQSELSRFCKRAQVEVQNGVQGFIADQVVVKEGNIVDEILKTAADHNCDAIVMGSAHHSALAEAMLGSVVKGVLRRADRMIIIAPPLSKKA